MFDFKQGVKKHHTQGVKGHHMYFSTPQNKINLILFCIKN